MFTPICQRRFEVRLIRCFTVLVMLCEPPFPTQSPLTVSERLKTMVVNLCLPHFSTTVHCNKLCADGYDVTNLLSGDPALRRRGFKLEYFLRPPVEVTLKFGFQVELCRVDVELWPWGMDKGQACKRLEISTSSDRLPSQSFDKEVKPQQGTLVQVKDQIEEQEEKSQQSNGHHWSFQARQWGDQGPDPQRGRVSKCQSRAESNNPEPGFKLVGRCELRDETQVCFTRSNFSPHPLFLSSPPPQPANSRQEALWSRGLLSLGAVTQLRVTVPFGGAASALGLKALAVWAQPARCCPAEEVERIRKVHEASKQRLLQPVLFASSLTQRKQPQRTATPASLSVPEEFLDPITQEVMTLPMLLPCGVSVDSTTLEEYQKREATWGRAPSDPFTGVPFTSTSHALPNPQLKMRIDHFVLQGAVRRDGMLGRQENGDNLQASRLIASRTGQPQNSAEHKINTDRTTQLRDSGSGHSSDNHTPKPLPVCTDNELDGHRRKRQDLSGISQQSTEETPDGTSPLPQAKRPRNYAGSSCSSHEQRLSASLDEALLSALQGRPSFTSSLSQHREISPHSEARDKTQLRKIPSEKTCSACSCSVSVYSTAGSSIYRLSCCHLLCHACLRRETQPRNSVTTSGTNQILCPACGSATPRTDVMRVHH